MTAETVYDSRAVANYFIRKADENGLDPLQIMKLTYIAHGFMLGAHDRPLLEDDVEAWQYGPVVRRVYNMLPSGATAVKKPPTDDDANFDEDAKAILDVVFKKYGGASGLRLSNLTHRPGSPWKKTWDNFGKNAVIPQDLIEGHYKEILAKARAARENGEKYIPEAF